MEFEQAAAVSHCEEGYLQLFCFAVELAFNFHTNCTSALVQDSEEGSMIEQSGHGDSLLLASRKDILPFIDSIETPLSLLDGLQLHETEQLSQMGICALVSDHCLL